MMATKPCRMHMPCGWSVLYEMEQYVVKRQHVAAACRLTVKEEISLLRQCKYYPQVSIHLRNRLALLEKLYEDESTEETLEVAMRYPEVARTPYCFETVIDGMILQNEVLRGFMSKAAAFTYKRPIVPPEKNTKGDKPTRIVGIEAAEKLHVWISKGMDLGGGMQGLGFPFFYELLTDKLEFKLLESDRPHYLGCVLMRLLPQTQTERPGVFISLLRILDLNRELAVSGDFPDYKEPKVMLLNIQFGGSPALKSILKGSNQFLDKNKTRIVWPNVYRSRVTEPPSTIRTKPLVVLMKRRPHVWGSPYVSDLEQAQLPLLATSTKQAFPKTSGPGASLSDNDIAEFGQHPLAQHMDQVALRTRAEQGIANVSPDLPICLDRHPCSVSHIAETTLTRFTDDCELFAEQINQSKSWRLTALFDNNIKKLGKDRSIATKASKQVRSIISALTKQKAQDMDFVRESIPVVIECANLVPDHSGYDQIKFLFARHSGAATEVWFELLIQYLVSVDGRKQLLYCNPFLTAEQVECIQSMTAAILFRVNRVQQLIRCLQGANGLLNVLQRIEANPKCFDEGLEKEVWLGAKTLAANIAAQRYYVKASPKTM